MPDKGACHIGYRQRLYPSLHRKLIVSTPVQIDSTGAVCKSISREDSRSRPIGDGGIVIESTSIDHIQPWLRGEEWIIDLHRDSLRKLDDLVAGSRIGISFRIAIQLLIESKLKKSSSLNRGRRTCESKASRQNDILCLHVLGSKYSDAVTV